MLGKSRRLLNIRLLTYCLQELGLVDEAKDAVEKWMARWIDIVSYLNLTIAHYPDRTSNINTVVTLVKITFLIQQIYNVLFSLLVRRTVHPQNNLSTYSIPF